MSILTIFVIVTRANIQTLITGYMLKHGTINLTIAIKSFLLKFKIKVNEVFFSVFSEYSSHYLKLLAFKWGISRNDMEIIELEW